MIAFVILHYNTIVDTEKCISSIEQSNEEGTFQIVVVDNNSPNGSGKLLLDMFFQKSYIHIILNEHNLGFAKGNNIGYSYAKNVLHADFIVLLNSDVIINQNHFYERVLTEYNINKFAVLGPKIITATGDENSNPGSTVLPKIKELRIYILKIRVLILLNYLHLDRKYKDFKSKIKRTPPPNVNNRIRAVNVLLHGCCWIFSPLFISKFDGINDRTFLYREEELLFLLIKNENLISVYSPFLEVIHNEHSSTNSISLGSYRKERFKYNQYIQSTQILIDEIKKSKYNSY